MVCAMGSIAGARTGARTQDRLGDAFGAPYDLSHYNGDGLWRCEQRVRTTDVFIAEGSPGRCDPFNPHTVVWTCKWRVSGKREGVTTGCWLADGS